ncbi:MAG: enoyl-CoA hydratase/isomerase family protein [Hyphomonadaceae bacterium]|jgi:enoyl-CoA hydratase/carnithine racemase|nr:enoyl-CoA hydratase/isomerase family protein [Hyphomonadaceae bacterium]
MAVTDKILARKEGRVGTLVFNNPERHNAVSLDMWEAASRVLDDFAGDAEVRVLVVTGAGGKAFVSGADISKFEDERATQAAVARYNSISQGFYAGLYNFPKPSIAQIQGYCIGGGLNLAISCDLRFCSEGSRFALPAARLGLGYGYEGLKRFFDTIGAANTKDIFFSARQFAAQEALAMGVVNKVLPDNELAAFVRDYANTVAENAPLTVNAIKQIAVEALKPESERNLQRAADLVARCFASQDYIEGRTAFMQKRKPVFTGQ